MLRLRTQVSITNWQPMHPVPEFLVSLQILALTTIEVFRDECTAFNLIS